jgi:hypothetical protein
MQRGIIQQIAFYVCKLFSLRVNISHKEVVSKLKIKSVIQITFHPEVDSHIICQVMLKFFQSSLGMAYFINDYFA